MTAALDPDVDALLARSHRLGADRRITNYAGGNTSAKVTLADPVTGAATPVLVVKGSGGDLGTLTADGLARLDLTRLRALERLSAAGVPEDDLVAYYESCRFGIGGAPPSIDTPLHAFLDAPHVDHTHPDSVIALAAAADGERLVQECYGGDVGWLDWQRPGFDLGLRLRDFVARHPAARGVVLGGHGVICWGASSEECEATTLELVERAEAFLDAHGRDEPLGAVVSSFAPLPDDERRLEATRLGVVARGIASTGRPVVGHFDDAPTILDFLSREQAPRLAAAGTSCPDHFLTTKVRPLFLDLPPRAPFEARVDAVARAAHRVPGRLCGLLRQPCDERVATDARRRPGHRAPSRRRDVELRHRRAPGTRRGRVLRERGQRDARRRVGVVVSAHRRRREVPGGVLGARRGEAPAPADPTCPRRTGRAR